jgi:hypothetical protein
MPELRPTGIMESSLGTWIEGARQGLKLTCNGNWWRSHFHCLTYILGGQGWDVQPQILLARSVGMGLPTLLNHSRDNIK